MKKLMADALSLSRTKTKAKIINGWFHYIRIHQKLFYKVEYSTYSILCICLLHEQIYAHLLRLIKPPDAPFLPFSLYFVQDK